MLTTERFNMIDASIPLQVQVPDIGKAVGLYYDTLNRNKEMKMKQEQSALRNQLVNRQMEKINKDEAIAENERMEMSMVAGAQTAQKLMDANDYGGALTFLKQRAGEILDSGRDASDTINAIQNLEAGNYDQVRSELGTIVDYGMNKGLIAQNEANSGAKYHAPILANDGNYYYPYNTENGGVGVEPLGISGQTKSSALNESSNLKIKENKLAKAMTVGKEIFDQIPSVSSSILNFNDAIELVNSPDAKTGPIYDMLPSFRENAVKLDNLVNRSGLDIIGAYTFGALSESELKFALNTAIPTSLKPEALGKWLTKKRDSQIKVRDALEEAAIFLSDGENTLSDYTKKRIKDRKSNKQKPKELKNDNTTAKSAIDELDKRMSAARGD